MRIEFARGLEKKTRRLPPKIAAAAAKRFRLFAKSSHHPILRNHALNGEWKGYRSINISGDWRAIYYLASPEKARFVDIGTHHDLYGS